MKNPWDARFGFFWYNDDEIFRFTEKDFDEKAKRMAETGINIVMTFSCTHFRWTMKQHWGIITKCLANVVKACHKYGILVVEHHSSHLTFDPLDEADWDRMDKVLKKRMSSIDSWDGLREYVLPKTIKGTEGYRQIDGRTGEYARTRYSGYGKCFNNPDYRNAYFDYLETLYMETGIDGIMTDDVQYFGNGHACTCEYCRREFKKEYGYELPEPGKSWEEFYFDFENTVFVAWQQFKKKSTLGFQEAVNEHFGKLGLKLLRPNYVSGNITFNWTGYPFEKALHLWDWVFQENCFAFVIKYSWPQFLTESRHRFNMGRIKGIPSMSMFYPDRYDSFYFSWALCMAWGQLFTATPEGGDMCSIEKKFRDFEKKYADILFNQKKKADVTIYWSYETANFCNPEKCRHITAVKSWTQALTFAGYSTDMVFASEEKIDSDIHRVLIVPDVWMLSGKEIKKLNEFAEAGGRILFTGTPGIRRPDGTKRSFEEVSEILRDEYPDNKTFIATTDLDDNYYEPLSVDRWEGSADRKPIPEYKADKMAFAASQLLKDLVKKKIWIEDTDSMINVYQSYDRTGKNMLIHIINAMGTMDSLSPDGGHDDRIPGFTEDCPKLTAFDVYIRKCRAEKAYFISIEKEEEMELTIGTKDGNLVVSVPGNTFSGYAVIRIPLEQE